MEQHEWRAGEQAILLMKVGRGGGLVAAFDGTEPLAVTIFAVLWRKMVDGVAERTCMYEVLLPGGAALVAVPGDALREPKPLPTAKDVYEIITIYLRERGLDGLAGDECGCSVDDLAPCDCINLYKCVPARKRVCVGREACGIDCEAGDGNTCFTPADGPWPPVSEEEE